MIRDFVKLEDLLTCNVLYLGMIIIDKFCDDDDASVISKVEWEPNAVKQFSLFFLN